MLSSALDLMARHFLHGQNVSFGLSVLLFTFMFLPTLLVLLAVVLFAIVCYPWLREAPVLDKELGIKTRKSEEN